MESSLIFHIPHFHHVQKPFSQTSVKFMSHKQIMLTLSMRSASIHSYTVKQHQSSQKYDRWHKKRHKVSVLSRTALYRLRHIFHSFDSKTLALMLRMFWWIPTGSDAEDQKFNKTQALPQLKLKRHRFTLSAWFCKTFKHEILICCRKSD